MKSFHQLILILFTCATATAQDQKPETDRQRLTAPLIPDLVAEHQDLDYDGLLAELPKGTAPLADLDFDPTKARYFDLVRHELDLTEAEVEIYRKRGFVSIDNGRGYSFTAAYHDIYTSDLPVLITTDSILYALHESYEEILQELETTWFTSTLNEVLGEAHEALAEKAKKKRDEGFGATYRDVDFYLTMARNLLAGAGAPETTQPPRQGFLKQQVKIIESKLGQDEAVAEMLQKVASLKLESPLQDSPTRIYGGTRFMDYSQFRPRGHYAKSPWLQSYFRAMMWLSRADTGWNVLPVQSETGLVSDDRRELANAVLFGELLRDCGGLDRLRAMDRLITYLVGNSDSMNVFRLAELMAETQTRKVGDLATPGHLESLQTAIRSSEAAKQFIRSQVLVSNPNDTYKIPQPATFQVFGQRFAIDSYVLSRLVFDAIIFDDRKQKRMMPTGLDVMAAFGNDTAIPLLEGELRTWKYSANLLASRMFVDQQKEDFWDKNLYSVWLNSLRQLDVNLAGERHAPQVMRTEAWQRKQLQTQLASWSQLRHNTVLYAKQSYTAGYSCEYPSGYVEPYPAFYANLKVFAERAQELIKATPYTSKDERLGKQLNGIRARQLTFFSNMATRLSQLEALARKELAAQPFTSEDRKFLEHTISRFGSAPLGSGSSPAYYGWYTELFYADQPHKNAFGAGYDGLSKFTVKNENNLSAMMNARLVRYGRADMQFQPTISDVHTDPIGKRALQVGVGPVNLSIVAVDNQDDRLAYVGPVFSYHEFSHPAENRLTDQEWMEMLRAGSQPARPSWTGSFAAPPKPRINYGTFASTRRLRSVIEIHVRTVRDPNSVKPEKEAAKPNPATLFSRPKPLTVELTDEGLETLSKYPSLRSLDLSAASITDQGLFALAPLKNLRNLSLSSTQIEGAGLSALQEAEWLRRLLLANTKVNDEAIVHLASLPHLEILDLSGTKVTNRCVAHLKKMAYLRDLDLKDTAVDQGALEELHRALPKCRIKH